MASPYTEVTVVNYNSNPPSDDGAQTAANRLQWSTHITKIGNPLKTAIETIDDNITAAFGKTVGGSGITSTAISYTVVAGDQGKLVKITGAGGVTITTPDATVVTAPFVFNVVNISSGSITIDGSGTQTIDGVDSFTMPAGNGAMFYTDGTNWFTAGQNFTKSFSPPAAFKKLSIKVATNTTVAVLADFVTTTDGASYQTTAVSSTIDLGSNGAVNKLDTGTIAINTWYAIWVIAKPDGTTGALASASFTAPTMPTGYTYKARIGAVQTINGSATLYGTWQLGDEVQYVVGLAQTSALPSMANGILGTYSQTAPTYAAVSVVRFVPPTASFIKVAITNAFNNGTAAKMSMAPNNSYSGQASATNPPPFNMGAVALLQQAITTEMMLESTDIYVTSDAAGGSFAVFGYKDNL